MSALEQARDALVSYAVGHTFRPGSMPCPDTDDDGVMESFVAGECPSYIGRLPWRTLGVAIYAMQPVNGFGTRSPRISGINHPYR